MAFPLHALLALVPVALDGESAISSNTGVAIISAVSMLFGYVGLALLWHFVFSAKARRKRGEKDPPP
jgi:hypothetical protein